MKKTILSLALAATLMTGGNIMAAQSIQFAEEQTLQMPDADPEEGDVESGSLARIVFTFPEDVHIKNLASYVMMGCTINKLEMGPAGNEYLGQLVGSYDVAIDPDHDNVVIYTANIFNITDPGRFVVSFPAMLVNTNLGTNEYWFYKYDVIEISASAPSLEIPEEPQPVYNLQGIKVLDKATPEVLNNLPQGLYLQGGKKILLGH